jgi:DNA invertase Pin-like site-specific DNA recombinase
MLIGYARVSTAEQSLNLQRDALDAAGCVKIFTDTVSGAKADRPGLRNALDYIREGDVLTVWKLDRLGRSLIDLVNTINTLKERGIHFKVLTENIDTSSPMVELYFHFTAALAQFERGRIRERTKAGLASARARGRKGGRPRKLTGKRAEMAAAMLRDPNNNIDDICETFKVSRPTLYRTAKTINSALPDTPKPEEVRDAS